MYAKEQGVKQENFLTTQNRTFLTNGKKIISKNTWQLEGSHFMPNKFSGNFIYEFWPLLAVFVSCSSLLILSNRYVEILFSLFFDVFFAIKDFLSGLRQICFSFELPKVKVLTTEM